MSSEWGAIAPGDASCIFSFGVPEDADFALYAGLLVRPYFADQRQGVLEQLVALVTRWFVEWGAGAAFVSFAGPGRPEQQDVPLRTAHEVAHILPTLLLWPDVCRYSRGAFWGTGLGPDLCDPLSGRDRVLRDAPVSVAQPLGDGAWLQLSGIPPAEPAELQQLATFLQPLLTWTAADLLAHARSHVTTIPPEEEQHRPRQRPIRGAPTLPVRFRRDFEGTGGFNLHLAAPPTAAQRDDIQAVMDAWYQDGFWGAFGGRGLHELTGPSVDGAVLRWFIDFGSADERIAVRVLAQRLAPLPGLAGARLVIGTEEAR
jgi:hypothetical protein